MSSLDSIYQELIIDHAKHPQGRGLVEPFDGESFQVNPVCGDQIRLRVRLADGEPVLRGVTWDGQGCTISQASVSLLTELVDGLPLERVAELEQVFNQLMHSRGHGLDQALEDQLGDAIALAGVSLYPMRVKCALLGWMALREAIAKALVGDSSPAHIPEGI
ncbi:MAG: SUF system NifU family Fe-S cluster assembly protein [Bifidobacteriaceae bacterium]|jgi:nitrogen fixation NifU-like protein|nr:SUF system NifU family Fe-S cluster assembly protein [Bifidobacteriaceae bacterium]